MTHTNEPPGFPGRFNRYLFARLDDVREATWRFLINYNEHREHDALNGMTPIEYRNQPARRSTFEMSA